MSRTKLLSAWLAALYVAASSGAWADPADGKEPRSFPELELTSPDTQVRLIELYTSEGCSSCPPADKWLNRLTDRSSLWREFVPVAFHVDYWNYIGWPDRFSSPRYSARQRSYARAGNVATVYTPGFVVAGREWRGWFRDPRLDSAPTSPVGALRVRLRDGVVQSWFAPRAPVSDARLELALLGAGITTEVRAGENEGRVLHHNFVVLGYEQAAMADVDGTLQGTLELPPASHAAPRYALAAWVSRAGDPTPLQAVGGWLARGAR